jgi:RNA polymerase sigma factor (TIGR02999 family)
LQAKLKIEAQQGTIRGNSLVANRGHNKGFGDTFGMRGLERVARLYFFALCAQIMRRLLVDHAGRFRYAKRGGDQVRVPLEETLLGNRARGVEVLALDDALASLAKRDPRKARVVELRFCGGLSVEETAEFLRISPETVLRDWKMAKVWLLRELSRDLASGVTQIRPCRVS